MDHLLSSVNAQMDTTASLEFGRFCVLFLERKEEAKQKLRPLLMSMSGTSRDDGLGERLAAGDALFDDFYYQALDDLAQAVYYVTGAPDSVASPQSVNPPTPSSMSVDNLTVDISSDESSSGGALDDQKNVVNNVFVFNAVPEVEAVKEKEEEEAVVDMKVEPQVGDSRGGGGIKRGRKMSSNDAQKKKKMETMMPQVSSTTSMTQCVDDYLANARTLSNASTLSNGHSLDNADYTAVPPPSSYLPNAGRRRRVSVSAPTLFDNAQLLEGTYHTRANARFLADACAAAPSVVDSAAHPKSPPPSTSSEPMPDPEVVAVESSLSKAIANARLSAFGTLNRFGNAHSPPPSRPNKPMHGSKDSDANARTLTNAYTRRRTVSACAPNLANAQSMENARRSSVSENGLSLFNAHSMEDAQSVANTHPFADADSLSNAQPLSIAHPLSNEHSSLPHPINNERMRPKRTIFRDLTNVTIPQEDAQSPPPSSHSASPPSYSLPSPSPTPALSPSPPPSLPVPVASVPESSHRSTTKWSKRYKEPLLQCLYPDCSRGFFSAYYQNVVRHIRVAHFGLPPSMAQQERLGIVDHRNAAPFVSKITKRNTEEL